jgi:hypothetical protein
MKILMSLIPSWRNRLLMIIAATIVGHDRVLLTQKSALKLYVEQFQYLSIDDLLEHGPFVQFISRRLNYTKDLMKPFDGKLRLYPELTFKLCLPNCLECLGRPARWKKMCVFLFFAMENQIYVQKRMN